MWRRPCASDPGRGSGGLPVPRVSPRGCSLILACFVQACALGATRYVVWACGLACAVVWVGLRPCEGHFGRSLALKPFVGFRAVMQNTVAVQTRTTRDTAVLASFRQGQWLAMRLLLLLPTWQQHR